MTTELSQDLLDILACPACKQPVELDGNSLRCRNPDCRLRYPVRDGIPIMLIEEAARDGAAATPGAEA